jgi:hypothetical protein
VHGYALILTDRFPSWGLAYIAHHPRSLPELFSLRSMPGIGTSTRPSGTCEWCFGPLWTSRLTQHTSNEEQVGSAIQSSSYPRSSVFLTTKLGHADRIMERLEESVAMIDPRPDGYVDLYTRADGGAGEEA